MSRQPAVSEILADHALGVEESAVVGDGVFHHINPMGAVLVVGGNDFVFEFFV